ncbi:AAA family ATPase [Hyphococcus sp.]|uniref:AAA family ATPase n=1 Tax=Hyphococcus sp. TaxID=2038636 RepID=UPI002084553A|nr:MAG: transcriptional regulator NadR [Marinicaulis sp.]
MKSRGFFLGKFMPPHLGHLEICNAAQLMVQELTVLVCSTPDEPMSGALRFKWMREAVPGAHVLHLHRHMPQTPDDHPDFWRIWRAAIRDIHPEPIDIVFAGEDYGHRLAEELGAKAHIIDRQQADCAISATEIRDNPAAHWRHIAAPARSHFQKRLTLLGPESIGKTTLAERLAKRFDTELVLEYGRTYDEKFMQSRFKQGKGWREQDLLAITETHAAMREALAPLAGPLLIEDTDALMTAVWAEHLLGAPVARIEAQAKASLADHYLLLTPETPWTDDGVRYAGRDEVRQWFFDAAKARLDRFGATYTIISGSDWEDRERQAVNVAEAMLG